MLDRYPKPRTVPISLRVLINVYEPYSGRFRDRWLGGGFCERPLETLCATGVALRVNKLTSVKARASTRWQPSSHEIRDRPVTRKLQVLLATIDRQGLPFFSTTTPRSTILAGLIEFLSVSAELSLGMSRVPSLEYLCDGVTWLICRYITFTPADLCHWRQTSEG